ncbi:hypothetical protein EPIR_2334 [Erwinia piriflorinigrans CFBP 5888]|uniref:Uncharacterized protein n=1 Tax=Erwinia piriflorinigrans CFBP 5888 TaxID=1161919 RepID=V5Z8Y3_9GAMM|nr:hypothetical protein EPIR_2334 [Erwinia piriflorinigrans CFBP 5888]
MPGIKALKQRQQEERQRSICKACIRLAVLLYMSCK